MITTAMTFKIDLFNCRFKKTVILILEVCRMKGILILNYFILHYITLVSLVLAKVPTSYRGECTGA